VEHFLANKEVLHGYLLHWGIREKECGEKIANGNISKIWGKEA